MKANEVVSELRSLAQTPRFKNVSSAQEVSLCSFSDAAHPRDRDYGQSGILICLLRRNGDGRNQVYHLINWTNQKQQRLSYSTNGAEILTVASSDDRGYYTKIAINTVFPKNPVKNELIVDSKALWDTIKTLHEGREYRLRQMVQWIRNSFERMELKIMRWAPGTENLADAITKRNVALQRKLNLIFATGIMTTRIKRGY